MQQQWAQGAFPVFCRALTDSLTDHPDYARQPDVSGPSALFHTDVLD